jgi:hypothetical protein
VGYFGYLLGENNNKKNLRPSPLSLTLLFVFNLHNQKRVETFLWAHSPQVNMDEILSFNFFSIWMILWVLTLLNMDDIMDDILNH